MKIKLIPIIFLAAITIGLVGCNYEEARNESLSDQCLAINMILDKEDISANSAGEVSSPISGEPINSAINSFTGPGLASHWIIQYERAEENFQNYTDFVFVTSRTIGQWEEPSIEIQNSVADEYKYACAPFIDAPEKMQCMYVGRYRSYLVAFGIDIGPNDFTLDCFKSGIDAIDREMSECFATLGDSTPTP